MSDAMRRERKRRNTVVCNFCARDGCDEAANEGAHVTWGPTLCLLLAALVLHGAEKLLHKVQDGLVYKDVLVLGLHHRDALAPQ
jgi:hypothetical protein